MPLGPGRRRGSTSCGPASRPLPASRRAALADAAGVEPTDAAVALLVQRDQDALALAAIDAVGPGGDAARVLTHVEHDIPADATATFDPTRSPGSWPWRASASSPPPRPRRCSRSSPSGAAPPTRRPSPPSWASRPWTTGELEALVDEAIAANADAWAKVLEGNDKAAGAITGHIMRATKGKADGKAVAELLAARKAAG